MSHGEAERWLPIGRFAVNYKHLRNGAVYEVSDLGRVRRGERILKGVPDENGYLRVSFWVDGKAKKVAVHILVAEAFLGPRPVGQVVRHRNGDHTINRLSNLRYGTPVENAADMVEHGTRVRGQKHPASRLTESLVIEMRARYVPRDPKNSMSAIARELGLPRQTVKEAILGHTWAHLPRVK
jgi:HNH endonuclease/NUMOD4 motif